MATVRNGLCCAVRRANEPPDRSRRARYRDFIVARSLLLLEVVALRAGAEAAD